MLSTAVCFPASSVDLFHGRTAGQGGRKLGVLFQKALLNLQIIGAFHYRLHLVHTPYSLPAISSPQMIFVVVWEQQGNQQIDHRLTEIPKPVLYRGFHSQLLCEEKEKLVWTGKAGAGPLWQLFRTL